MTDNYILTHTHRRFDYGNMRTEDVCIVDLIEGAPYVYRFGGMGAVQRVSMAQHVMAASYVATKEFALEALCHDLHEVLWADFPGPAKKAFPVLAELEAKVESVVRRSLGLSPEMSAEVKKVDTFLAGFELMCGMGATTDAEPLVKYVFEANEFYECERRAAKAVLDLRVVYAEKDPEAVKQLLWARYHEVAP